jgi:hypothetical protein
MPDEILVGRVEALERRVTSLEELPARVDALALQVLQLGEVMQVGFSEIRAETRQLIQASKEETLQLIQASKAETLQLIQASKAETLQLIQASEDETRLLAREGDEETRRLMRVLHEDVIARIALINEGR